MPEIGGTMKRVTILKAAAHYEALLIDKGFTPKRLRRNYRGTNQKIWGNHALFMIRRVKVYIYTRHRDKAMRWLAYCQGVINAQGISTIQESKIQLMPKKRTVKK